MDELKNLVKRLRDSGLGYGAIAQRIGYGRSGVKKLLQASEKKHQSSVSQKEKHSLKSLVTKLDNIRNGIRLIKRIIGKRLTA